MTMAASTDRGREFAGSLDGKGLRFALIVSRFNDFVTSRLVAGALDALTRHGVAANDVHTIWVPGAWEIPPAAAQLATGATVCGDLDGLVCLGAVIRGSTPHFDHVCSRATSGLARVADDTGIPIGFGVLTCDTIEQAIERAGSKAGNKGAESALAALEMANLHRLLEESADA